jgi:predicted PurR-regulated permease PerM
VTNETPSLSDTNAPAMPANASHPGLSGTVIGEKAFDSITRWLKDLLPKAGSWVAAFFAVIAGLALIPIYAFYLLLEKRGIQSKWTNYLPVKDSTFKDELVFILQSINDYMIAFFRGQVLVAICDGFLYGIGFCAIHLQYAILLGAAAMVLTIVPFIGAIIIFVTAMIIALVQFGDWKHPLLVLLVFGIVQTLEGVVISPRIMRGRVGLHPLTIIVAVMVGTTLLGGLLGGVLAIPLTAVLRVLMARYVWKRPLPRETS